MKIDKIVHLPIGVAIRWEDRQESLIAFKTLRDACPCANCSGESDLFGNKTFGIPSLKTDKTYDLQSFHWVGHYAIQFVWADKHDAGIYSLDLLRKLGMEEESESE